MDPVPTALAVELTGPPEAAVFPPLCVRCGAPPAGTATVERLFRVSGGDAPDTHALHRVTVPACAACLAEHAAAERPLPRELRRRLLRGWAVGALPFVVPVGIALWLGALLAPHAAELAGPGANPVERVAFLAGAGFVAVVLLLMLNHVAGAGRRLVSLPEEAAYARTERGPLGSRLTAPVEPTPLTRAVSFGANEADLFDARRHRWRFTHADVAQAFEAANADRRWDAASPRAEAARIGRWLLFGAIGLAVLWGLYAEWGPR